MTRVLQRAMAEVEKLSAEDQDAIASRVLAEIEDERQWHVRFSATSDEQYDRMAAEAGNDAASARQNYRDSSRASNTNRAFDR